VKGREQNPERIYTVYIDGYCNIPLLLALCLYHTASKHSFIPWSGQPFYLLPSFPRRAASSHNLLPFHVWSTVEEDKGLVQVKINEVVYIAYVHQDSQIPLFLSRCHLI